MEELIFRKLEELKKRYEELEVQLADSRLQDNISLLISLGKEHSELREIMELREKYEDIENKLQETREILETEEGELKELAKEEVRVLESERDRLMGLIRKSLLPKDVMDERSVFIEIRGAAGGEESALFAADLLRMYIRYAEMKKFSYKLVDYNATDIGGYKEVILEVEGKGAYSQFKYESGVHRVQRVPTTEASGRVHTSTVTVAVLPEVEDVEVDIKDDDLRIDTFRSSGAGGQHVQMTDSAIRITHLPTGLVVTCQDERSQLKNKEKAMKVLRARLFKLYKEEQEKTIASQRKTQVGTGERSEKIRTYNFPQNRITDHRIGLSLYNLSEILDGNMEPLIEPLMLYAQEEALKNL